MKSERERQTPYDFTYVWNLKYSPNESTYKIETDSQTWGTDLCLSRGKWEEVRWMGSLGLVDAYYYFFFFFCLFVFLSFLGLYPWPVEIPRLGIEPATSWFLVGFINHWATTGTPTITFRIKKQWGLKVQYRELYPISWDRTWWKIIWEKECMCVCVCVCVCVFIYICMSGSLGCTAEIDTTL